MQACARAEVGHGAGVVRRPAAYMTESDAHTIARNAAQADTNEHVARIAQVVGHSEMHDAQPVEAGHFADVFDCGRIMRSRRVFDVGRDDGDRFAGQEIKVGGKEHDARARVGAERDRGGRHERLALPRHRFKRDPAR